MDKVSRPTCRSVELLAGRVHLTGTFRTLLGGDPWVPMSHNYDELLDKHWTEKSFQRRERDPTHEGEEVHLPNLEEEKRRR
jgi:hypothetical protein